MGASTGGFTDLLLQRGAKKVYAVDVGYGQLAWKLRKDPRVVVLERQNIRYLSPDAVPEKINLAVIDVAFISLKLVFPCLKLFLGPKAIVVALIKPQFEVARHQVGPKGVVRDPALHDWAIDKITKAGLSEGWDLKGVCESPLLGPEGNKEFLIYFQT